MSLLYQILIPFQISVPCIYPSSKFDYSFKLLDDTLVKFHFEPYPMGLQSRFFQTTIDYVGLIGTGHASVNIASSCDEFPAISAEFIFNQTSYKLTKNNNNFVISSGDVDPILLNAATSEALCGTNNSLHNQANSVLGIQPDLLAATTNQGCPTATKYVNLGIQVDCSVIQQTSNIEAVTQEVLANLAKTNVAYKQFNVQLILSVLEIRSSCSQKYTGVAKEADLTGEFDRWNVQCRSDYSLMQRISDFSKWRGNRNTDVVDIWHLYSTCSSDSKVGLAWPSSVCYKDSAIANGNYYFSGVSISTRQINGWKVMAHEIGHQFGAIHDCLAPTSSDLSANSCCKCGNGGDCNGQYLMNPNQQVATNDFSACTVTNFCSALSGFSCLQNSTKSMVVFKENVCGNGIKEPGEECDCGDLCATDRCCTKDCKLTQGSKCSDKNDGCCSSCQLKPSKSVCRKAEGVCDYQEVCSGTSATCPNDLYSNDGTSCLENGFSGHCASKYCTSANKQCTDSYPSSTGSCSGASFQNTECTLSCNTVGGCAVYNTNLIDGSICGGGYGLCESGVCAYSSLCNFKTNLVDMIRGNIAAYQIMVIMGCLIVGAMVAALCIRRRNKKRKLRRKIQRTKEKEEDFISEFANAELRGELPDSTAIKSPTKRRFSKLKDISYSREDLLDTTGDEQV